MKFLYPVLVFLGFTLAGYVFYPSVSGVHPLPGQKPAPAVSQGPSSNEPPSIPAADFPDKVTLKIAVVVYSKDRQTSFELPAGQLVTPVSLERGLLTVRPGTSPLEGEVAVAATDFLEKVAAKRASNPTPSATASEPAVVDNPVPVSQPVVEPTPAPVSEPAAQPAPVVDPAVEPAPVVDPAPVAEPLPVVEAAPPVASGGLDSAAVVALMQASVAGGAVTELKDTKVSSWEATADEVIDGQTYQTGLAVYEINGPFGVSSVRAKALIQGGKVIKWIGAKSGLELK
jgi:hypothetical protein